MTTLLDRSLTASLPSSPLPAAGRPATVAPPRSRPVSIRPAPGSMRPPPSMPPPSSQQLMADDDDDDDDGRTVVRGAPKIVKRSSVKSLGPQASTASISPAAVIKATLESARASTSSRRDQLLPGPPSDLLEDSGDFHNVTDPPRTPFIGLTPSTSRGLDRVMPTAPFEGPPSHRPPANFAPPVSSSRGQVTFNVAPSAPMSSPGGNYGPHTNYGPVPSASVSVPGVAMSAAVPAHFMTPQAPYSDPPATAVTSGHKVSGRPATSWAIALLACGLFVGVAAVAVMHGNDSVADTTASFVDPSKAPKAAAQPAAPMQPTPVPAAAPETENAASTANAQAAPPVASPEAPPPGLIGASPVAPPPVASPEVAAPEQPAVAAAPAAATATTATTPPAPTQGVAFAPVAVPPSAPAPKPVATPAPPPATATARPAVAWKPTPASPPPAAKPVARPAPADEEPAPKKTAKKAGKGGSDTDDETKKALEALQKAQLESASSFGDK